MLLFWILIYLVIFTAIMFFLVKIAPVGFEDEDGFHYFKESKVDIPLVNSIDKLIDKNIAA